MLKATIKELDLTNFKGFAKLHKQLDNKRESIKAENGQGKSTLRDAYFWLLAFNVGDVIPSVNNKEIPNLDIKVEARIEFQNEIGIEERVFTRTQKEIWKTNKDTGVDEKINNESTYAIDSIEFTLKNYKDKISELFGVPYEKMQMLCQKEFFNTDNADKWKWSNRRKELFDLCNVDNLLLDLVKKEEYKLIASEINKGYSTTDIKKQIKREQVGFKEEKERNLTLISDKANELAKYNSIDFDALTNERNELENELTKVSMQDAKQTINIEIQKLENEKGELNLSILRLKTEDVHNKSELENKINFIGNELLKVKNKANNIKDEISQSKTMIEGYEKQIEQLSNSFWSGDTICPTCKQNLPSEIIDTSKTNFECEKQSKIEKAKATIDTLKNAISSSEKQVDNMRETYSTLMTEQDGLREQLEKYAESPKIVELYRRVEEINEQLTKIVNSAETETDNDKIIKEIKSKISVFNEQLAYKKVASDISLRIENLKNQNKDLTDKEMLSKTKIKQLDNYVKDQVNMVTDTINSIFSNGVSFSLFNELYAGNEHEIKETCICMLNGKTYEEMSYGEKYLADLEVVKTLQKEYKVILPIFLDNAECVTSDYNAEQQLVELFAERGKFIEGIKIETIL